MTEFQEYPKWKYHPTEKARIVEGHAEEQALGEGWQDQPIPPAPPPAVTAADPQRESTAGEQDLAATPVEMFPKRRRIA